MNKKVMPLICSVAGLTIAMESPYSFATSQSVATVITSKGDVQVINGGKKRSLARKSEIFLKEVIATKDDSYAQLRIHDGTLVSIKPNTEYSIDEFNLDKKNPKNNKFVGKLIEGALISLSSRDKNSSHNNHTVKTPVVSIAIRGTMFEVNSKTTKVDKDQLTKLRKNQKTFPECRDVHMNVGFTHVLDGALKVNGKDGEFCDISADDPTNNSCSWKAFSCFQNNKFTYTPPIPVRAFDPRQPIGTSTNTTKPQQTENTNTISSNDFPLPPPENNGSP